MAFQNEEQIAKYQNNKVVLEFNDHMFPAKVESAASLHAGYSKIYIVVVDTSKGKGKDAKVIDANVDPIKMKRLWEKVNKIPEIWEASRGTSSSGTGSNEIQIGMGPHKDKTPSEVLIELQDKGVTELQGLIPIFQKNASKYPINNKKIEAINKAIDDFKKGNLKPQPTGNVLSAKTLFYEKKIIGNDNNKNDKGEFKVTILSIEYNPRMENCWTFFLENGWGQKETNTNGGYSIKRSTYRKEKDVKVFIDDEKFREITRVCNDYIMNKERIFQNELNGEMEKFRIEKRKKALAANGQE